MSGQEESGTSKETGRVHARLRLAAGDVALRDLQESDLEQIADYWCRAKAEFLRGIGIDRSKLGLRNDLISRFRQLIPRYGDQSGLSFAVEIGGRLIGYTNLNHYSAEENVSHWHLIEPAMRRQGISTALYPYRLRTYFSCVPMEKLTHQTRTSNLGMNKVLDQFVPIAETRFLENPDGLASPGEFNLRYVRRSDVRRILAGAEYENDQTG